MYILFFVCFVYFLAPIPQEEGMIDCVGSKICALFRVHSAIRKKKGGSNYGCMFLLLRILHCVDIQIRFGNPWRRSLRGLNKIGLQRVPASANSDYDSFGFENISGGSIAHEAHLSKRVSVKPSPSALKTTLGATPAPQGMDWEMGWVNTEGSTRRGRATTTWTATRKTKRLAGGNLTRRRNTPSGPRSTFRPARSYRQQASLPPPWSTNVPK